MSLDIIDQISLITAINQKNDISIDCGTVILVGSVMTDEKVNGTGSRHLKIKFGGDNQAAILDRGLVNLARVNEAKKKKTDYRAKNI